MYKKNIVNVVLILLNPTVWQEKHESRKNYVEIRVIRSMARMTGPMPDGQIVEYWDNGMQRSRRKRRKRRKRYRKVCSGG